MSRHLSSMSHFLLGVAQKNRSFRWHHCRYKPSEWFKSRQKRLCFSFCCGGTRNDCLWCRGTEVEWWSSVMTTDTVGAYKKINNAMRNTYTHVWYTCVYVIVTYPSGQGPSQAIAHHGCPKWNCLRDESKIEKKMRKFHGIHRAKITALCMTMTNWHTVLCNLSLETSCQRSATYPTSVASR